MKTKYIVLGTLAFFLAFSIAAFVIKKPKPDPKAAEFYFTQGKELFNQSKFDEAIDAYKKGVELDPTSSNGYNLLGMGYRSKYQTTKKWIDKYRTIRYFKKAVKADPKNYKALINLGTTYYYLGDKRTSIPYFEKAIDAYPENPNNTRIKEMIEKAKR